MAPLWAQVCSVFPSDGAFTTLSDRARREPLIVSHTTRLSKCHENILIHAVAPRLASVCVLAFHAHSYSWTSLLASKHLPQLNELSLDDPIPVSTEALYEESFALAEPLVAPALESVHLRGGRLLHLKRLRTMFGVLPVHSLCTRPLERSARRCIRS